MSKELGRIQKPSLERFKDGRKLYCVPLIPCVEGNDVPKDYHESVSLYWRQVAEQVENLKKAGKVSKVYYESVSSSGEEAMDTIKRMDEESYKLVKAKCAAGTTIQALEDKDCPRF